MAKALIGAQMFTLRDHCATPADIAQSCAKVKAMGYDGIQASAAGFNEIDANELKKILDGEGLACAATHKGLDALRDQTEQMIEYHQVLDCKYTAIGGIFPRENWTRAMWEQFIKDFNETARKFKDADLSVGYHNHSHEFAPVEDGAIPYAMLVENLNKHCWFEVDTYWVAHGGGDPASWIEAVEDRIPCVHYKDMTITPQREQKMCEVGDGNLNWPRINKRCKKAGVEWYLVERDSGDMDPFDSLKRSIENMREMGL